MTKRKKNNKPDLVPNEAKNTLERLGLDSSRMGEIQLLKLRWEEAYANNKDTPSAVKAIEKEIEGKSTLIISCGIHFIMTYFLSHLRDLGAGKQPVNNKEVM